MTAWRQSTWGDEISLEYGKRLQDYSEAGSIRVFGANGPIGWTDKPLADGPGVILGRKGAYRGVHYSSRAFFVIDTAYFVLPKNELHMRWLYYAIIFHQLGQIDDGSPIPSTTRAAVYPREILVPPPGEQRTIARALGALDDKIEQNCRTARTLERLTRAIYRAWFVDFEPVKAKAAGATSFPSMSQDAFNALPARLVDSEIGSVPEGWEVKAIDDLVTLKGGGTPSTKNPAYWHGGKHCWATPKDVSRLAQPVLLDTGRHITDAGVDCIASGLLPAGTVLMSSRAPVGHLALAQVPTAINQGFIAMICDGPVPPVFVLNWLSSSMETIRSRASGTTFPEISKTNFRTLALAEPPEGAVEEYRRISEPLFRLLTSYARENEVLAKTRDFLLPELLSGRVRLATPNG